MTARDPEVEATLPLESERLPLGSWSTLELLLSQFLLKLLDNPASLLGVAVLGSRLQLTFEARTLKGLCGLVYGVRYLLNRSLVNQIPLDLNQPGGPRTEVEPRSTLTVPDPHTRNLRSGSGQPTIQSDVVAPFLKLFGQCPVACRVRRVRTICDDGDVFN